MTDSKFRRGRLVEKGGVEAFEVRTVVWFDKYGKQWTTTEVTVPEGHSLPQLVETLGALEVAKGLITELHQAGIL